MANEERLNLQVTIDEQTLQSMTEIVQASKTTNELYEKTSAMLRKMIIPSTDQAEINPLDMEKFEDLISSITSPGGGIPVTPKTITVLVEALHDFFDRFVTPPVDSVSGKIPPDVINPE